MAIQTDTLVRSRQQRLHKKCHLGQEQSPQTTSRRRSMQATQLIVSCPLRVSTLPSAPGDEMGGGDDIIVGNRDVHDPVGGGRHNLPNATLSIKSYYPRRHRHNQHKEISYCRHYLSSCHHHAINACQNIPSKEETMLPIEIANKMRQCPIGTSGGKSFPNKIRTGTRHSRTIHKNITTRRRLNEIMLFAASCALLSILNLGEIADTIIMPSAIFAKASDVTVEDIKVAENNDLVDVDDGDVEFDSKVEDSTSNIVESDKDNEDDDNNSETLTSTESGDEIIINAINATNPSLPPSIAKATLVGAELRRQGENAEDEKEDHENQSKGSEHQERTEKGKESASSNHMQAPNVNTGEVDSNNVDGQAHHNPKPPLTGCHWGAAGCNKGTKMPLRHNVAANASASTGAASQTSTKGTKPPSSTGSSSSSPQSSSFAGSTTAAIEARVMEARGGNRKPKPNTMRNKGSVGSNLPGGESGASTQSSSATSTSTDDVGDNSNPDAIPHTHNPPQGFQLTARIVTSPSDGLSYFLDFPLDDPNSEDALLMFSIPYSFVECGPTIESTTDAFSLTDMVARHFPGGADPGHWVNLGGGVTMDNGDDEEDGENGPRYLNGNLHDGHPKLLVALSPIEITVSGHELETRTFQPGDVILMEDTLGKGHKMRAAPTALREEGDPRTKHVAHGQDLSVLMISLPHTVHYPMYDWNDDPAYLHHSSTSKNDDADTVPTFSPSSPAAYSGAQHSLFGLRSKHHRHGSHPRGNFPKHKPCPLEYDSAYSSLFKPVHNRRGRHRTRRRDPHWKRSGASNSISPFDDTYHPPPGHTTYSQQKQFALLQYLPSLRRTMLFGLGLSLTSSFVYCVQLLYPPLLALWGGATVVLVGAAINLGAMRWGYREWLAVWEEEWRWRREVKNQKKKREKRGVKSRKDDGGDGVLHDETKNEEANESPYFDAEGIVHDLNTDGASASTVHGNAELVEDMVDNKDE